MPKTVWRKEPTVSFGVPSQVFFGYNGKNPSDCTSQKFVRSDRDHHMHHDHHHHHHHHHHPHPHHQNLYITNHSVFFDLLYQFWHHKNLPEKTPPSPSLEEGTPPWHFQGWNLKGWNPTWQTHQLRDRYPKLTWNLKMMVFHRNLLF